ncbi:MAG: hypothetical protein AB8G11_26560 [Saprospiraceae bacterium]
MLSFCGIIPFDFQILPLVYSFIFIIYYLAIHLKLQRLKDTFLFMLIAFCSSFLYDKILINNNLYKYNVELFHLFNIPISALVIWSTAIFQAYYFNTGILCALGVKKPAFADKEFLKLLLLIIVDGLHIMTIGIFMEYWIVKYGLGDWIIDTVEKVYDLPIVLVLGSYFIVGVLGSGTFRVIEFFKNQAIIPKFSGYHFIFGTIYLVCFLISLVVLFDTNFYPIFVILSIVMFLIMVMNEFFHRKIANYDKD